MLMYALQLPVSLLRLVHPSLREAFVNRPAPRPGVQPAQITYYSSLR